MSILKFIKSYDNSEPKKNNKFLKNFEPVLFKKVKAFSLKIKNQSSLFNYTDLHHDGRFALNMSVEGGGLDKFSKNEKKLQNNIENLIYKTFKKKKNIQDSYSSSLVSARYIIKHFKKSSVFEIGPGTGYLGVMLKKNGFNYSCFEITQPHYVYQNFIFKKILGANAPVPILKVNEKKILGIKSFHLPWWKALSIQKYLNLTKPKIIIMNHCVNEMSREALNYLCGIFSKLENEFYIFIEGFGSQKLYSRESSLNIFNSHNFKIFTHQPVSKYNITMSACRPITLLSNKNIKSRVSYISLRGFFSKFGVKKIFIFLLNFYKIRFNFYKYKIYFLDFLVIKRH